MADPVKLAQAVVGPYLPFGFMTMVGYGAVKFGGYLDSHLKGSTRDAYLGYLRNGGLRDSSRTLIDVAAETIDHVFGPRHLSWRCLLRSILFTIGSITFFVGLSGLMSFSVSLLGNDKFNWFLGMYWSMPFKLPLWGALVWLLWACLIDYFSLFKTRWLIRLLQRWRGFTLFFCMADFVVGFAIYTSGMSLLSLLPLMLQGRYLPAPTVSLETAWATMLLVVIFSKAFMPNFESVVQAKGQLTPQIIWLLHSDAPQTMLAMGFLVQAIPFVTIGSDLFWASMMPSV